MTRARNIFVVLMAATGLALAQAPPAANAPTGLQAPARPRFVPIPIGPSAFVPPEVAIPHPTPAEVAQINQALTKWIDTDQSADRTRLKKYESLLMLQAPRLNVAATYTPTQMRLGARHDGFVEIAKKGDIDLLLHGDSITDWWTQGDENKATFEKYFGAYKTANFAIAGDTTNGVLWGLRNGEGQGFQPKAIMLMIGTNNTGGAEHEGTASAAGIAEGIGAVVLEMRNDFPQAKILLLAIFPRGANPSDPLRGPILKTNDLLARRFAGDPWVTFLDLGARFLAPDGSLPSALMPDGTHPSDAGYQIWADALIQAGVKK